MFRYQHTASQWSLEPVIYLQRNSFESIYGGSGIEKDAKKALVIGTAVGHHFACGHFL